jgi:flagellar biosynthesis GTPase FlhF
MNESLWEKLNAVRPAVKQMICDYVQLNAAAGTFNQTIDPYKESPSTLLGDIHRVKRYFYHTIGQIQELPYLDRKAVDLAIDEIRLSYDDDGNVLSTIHDYLRTFCSTNTNFNEKEIEIKIHKWSTRIKQLKDDAAKFDKEIADLKPKCTTIKQDLQMQELRWSNICNEEKEVEKKANELTTAASKGLTSRSTVLNLKDKFDEVKKIRDDYQKKKKAAEENLEQTRIDFQMTVKKGEELLEKLKNNQKEKNDLESKLKLIEADEHRKLKVKIGRGLLLYGPPGTGKLTRPLYFLSTILIHILYL